MKHVLIISLPLCVLTACSGGGGGTATAPTVVTVPALSQTAGDTEVAVEVSPGGDTITVTKSGGPEATSTLSAPDVGTYRTVFDDVGDYTFAFVSTGDGSVAGGATYEDGAEQTHGVFYERIGDTDLPTTGSATFTGDYLAMLIDPATGGTLIGAGITGNASLTVDFAESTVSGEITDRGVYSLVSGDPFGSVSGVDPMMLELTSLSATGTFIGDASGGAITSGMSVSTISASSFYSGLVAGADAGEAVGAVSALHTLGLEQFLEIGTFAAGH